MLQWFTLGGGAESAWSAFGRPLSIASIIGYGSDMARPFVCPDARGPAAREHAGQRRDHECIGDSVYARRALAGSPSSEAARVHAKHLTRFGGNERFRSAEATCTSMVARHGLDPQSHAPAIDPERYPNARRVGAFQIHYGWLMENYWPVTRGAGEGLISQRQAFWSRF